MAALLSMKEVTQITGATESALRYYNAKGVLMPTVREETGRRQWFYDDEAILKLKRLSLLKYLGLTIEEAGAAIHDDKTFIPAITRCLEELKRERDNLSFKYFIAKSILATDESDLFPPDDETDEGVKQLIIGFLKEYSKEGK